MPAPDPLTDSELAEWKQTLLLRTERTGPRPETEAHRVLALILEIERLRWPLTCDEAHPRQGVYHPGGHPR